MKGLEYIKTEALNWEGIELWITALVSEGAMPSIDIDHGLAP